MGAILAILGEEGDPELGERLQRMLERSPYRGEPEFLVEGPLAIGIQSMGWDASLHSAGNWLVAFHGYIGNWGELSSAHGWSLPEDSSNAGWIAAAYEAIGDDLFAKLRGEWAVVILNRHRREMLAVRDVVGCRPLFRSEAGRRLFLASEIRQIHAGKGAHLSLNEDALTAYLVQHPLTDGQTAHNGIFRILPARIHRCRLPQPDTPLHSIEYWHPPPEGRRSRRDLPGLAEQVRHLLENAVLRSLPNQPFMCSLSGGMDSGSIWGIVLDLARRGEPRANEGRTVSLVYPGLKRDESAFIRTHGWLPGADPIFIDGTAYRSVDHMDDMADAVDGIHESTFFEIRVVALAGRADGRRVELCGIGGDEWFMGGAHYLFDLLRHGRPALALSDGIRLARSPRWGIRRTVRAYLPPDFSHRRMSFQPPPPPLWLHHGRHDLYRRLQLLLPFGSLNSDSACRRRLLHTLTFRRCDDALASMDQISSQCGVEERSPLMDLDLIEFALRTDGQIFVAGERNKHLMRIAMRGTLPEEVLSTLVPSSAVETIARGLPELAAQAIDEDWLLTRLQILDPGEHRKTLEMAASGIIRGATHIYSLFATEWLLRKHAISGSRG